MSWLKKAGAFSFDSSSAGDILRASASPASPEASAEDDLLRFHARSHAFAEFSNFAPFGFDVDGSWWPTVEHFFQAQKFPGEEFAEYREAIRLAPTPAKARALGRSPSCPLRADWEEAKEAVMRQALGLKFQQPNLRQLLLSTADRPLIEDTADDYWGNGATGSGRNHLGILLMELRRRLRNDDPPCALDGSISGP